MNIIVVGAVQFTFEMLKAISKTEYRVVGVVTSDSAGINADYVDLGPYCIIENIPIYKTSDINSYDSLRWVMSLGADVMLCLGWSKLIKKKMLQATKLGVIGYHPSRLPQNRGRHPLIWALALGLKETGSTFFFMDEGVDSGDILSQSLIRIEKEDDAGTLYKKMIEAAGSQIVDFLPQLENGNYSRVKQRDIDANVWRIRSILDGLIDWRMRSESFHNLVRSLTRPYVGAHFLLQGVEYRVWKTSIRTMNCPDNIEPGKVLCQSDGVVTVRCGEGCIVLLEVSPAVVLKEGMYL